MTRALFELTGACFLPTCETSAHNAKRSQYGCLGLLARPPQCKANCILQTLHAQNRRTIYRSEWHPEKGGGDLVRREIRWCVTVRHELYWQAALEKERRILIQRECVPEEFHSFKDDLIRQGAAIRQNSAKIGRAHV